MSVSLSPRPDATVAARWPDVASVPRCSPARAAVARFLVRRALARLPLRVCLPDGETLGLGGPLLRINAPEAFFRRLGACGLVGFGESYMAGEWETEGHEGLTDVLGVLAAHVTDLVPAPLQRLRAAWALRHPKDERNTPEGARENIHRHYDLSNDLFELFLDETMTYSSAVFRGFPADPQSFAEAQRRKIDRLLDLAGVGEGTRLLEIGTGWGELALRAAVRGAKVLTVTLSREQADLANARLAAAGLADRVEVRVRDYREVRGEFDAIVSVEMIEAVGVEYWPAFFRALDRLLAPGGRVGLQAITMAHDRMQATRNTYTWIHKYVFPGGVIPSLRAIEEVTGRDTALRVTQCDAFGPHYAETLRLWRERFAERAEQVTDLGFDEVFQRMWTFYLAYSEAGFRSGYLDVHQLQLTRNGETR
ncbi:MAG TPA: cyclopropane-fatty-acyl-phospholipid synthase family protein [Streptomyces sp.]|nr:cyclopropane-fatty-acyl-phospholipid synthase family protein [Streptomyces sp.]